MKKWIDKNILYLTWLQAVVALVGSLYFSEIMDLAPCILCWYQRIAMYPLVPILTVGIVKKDKNLPFYVLPLSIFGLLVAIYHNLLYYNIIPESAAPCTLGVSCTTKYIEWFGFVTIPLLSLLGFMFVSASMLYIIKNNKK